MSMFFNIRDLSLTDKQDLLNQAYEKSSSFWVDHLDCSKSWRRVKVDMTYEEVLTKLESSSHFTVILRNNPLGEVYGEVGFVSNDSYYLWIILPEDKFMELVSDWKLKPVV